MWRDVASIYRESKKKQDINWFTEWVCRPPAAVVVYALRPTPVTPNQVTFASLAVAAGSAAMLALLPGPLWLIAAIAVFELSFILDCADGQLARARGQASPLGHHLDFLMDELKAMLVFSAVTIRLWRGAGDDLYLIAGLAGLFALASSLSLTKFTRREEYGAKPPTADGQPAEIESGRGLVGRAVSGLMHAARIVVHYPQYIWLAAALDRMDVYFWAYGSVHVLYLGWTLLAIARRLGRFQPGD